MEDDGDLDIDALLETPYVKEKEAGGKWVKEEVRPEVERGRGSGVNNLSESVREVRGRGEICLVSEEDGLGGEAGGHGEGLPSPEEGHGEPAREAVRPSGQYFFYLFLTNDST